MSDDALEVIKRLYARWSAGDFSDVSWADPEIEYQMPGPDAATFRGAAAMNEFWSEWLRSWKGFRVEPKEFYAAGDKVVVAHTFHGTGRVSGVSLTEPAGCAVFTMRNGRAIVFRGYVDVEEALRDAGVERG